MADIKKVMSSLKPSSSQAVPAPPVRTRNVVQPATDVSTTSGPDDVVRQKVDEWARKSLEVSEAIILDEVVLETASEPVVTQVNIEEPEKIEVETTDVIAASADVTTATGEEEEDDLDYKSGGDYVSLGGDSNDELASDSVPKNKLSVFSGEILSDIDDKCAQVVPGAVVSELNAEKPMDMDETELDKSADVSIINVVRKPARRARDNSADTLDSASSYEIRFERPHCPASCFKQRQHALKEKLLIEKNNQWNIMTTPETDQNLTESNIDEKVSILKEVENTEAVVVAEAAEYLTTQIEETKKVGDSKPLDETDAITLPVSVSDEAEIVQSVVPEQEAQELQTSKEETSDMVVIDEHALPAIDISTIENSEADDSELVKTRKTLSERSCASSSAEMDEVCDMTATTSSSHAGSSSPQQRFKSESVDDHNEHLIEYSDFLLTANTSSFVSQSNQPQIEKEQVDADVEEGAKSNTSLIDSVNDDSLMMITRSQETDEFEQKQVGAINEETAPVAIDQTLDESSSSSLVNDLPSDIKLTDLKNKLLANVAAATVTELDAGYGSSSTTSIKNTTTNESCSSIDDSIMSDSSSLTTGLTSKFELQTALETIEKIVEEEQQPQIAAESNSVQVKEAEESINENIEVQEQEEEPKSCEVKSTSTIKQLDVSEEVTVPVAKEAEDDSIVDRVDLDSTENILMTEIKSNDTTLDTTATSGNADDQTNSAIVELLEAECTITRHEAEEQIEQPQELSSTQEILTEEVDSKQAEPIVLIEEQEEKVVDVEKVEILSRPADNELTDLIEESTNLKESETVDGENPQTEEVLVEPVQQEQVACVEEPVLEHLPVLERQESVEESAQSQFESETVTVGDKPEIVNSQRVCEIEQNVAVENIVPDLDTAIPNEESSSHQIEEETIIKPEEIQIEQQLNQTEQVVEETKLEQEIASEVLDESPVVEELVSEVEKELINEVASDVLTVQQPVSVEEHSVPIPEEVQPEPVETVAADSVKVETAPTVNSEVDQVVQIEKNKDEEEKVESALNVETKLTTEPENPVPEDSNFSLSSPVTKEIKRSPRRGSMEQINTDEVDLVPPTYGTLNFTIYFLFTNSTILTF